MSPDYVLKALQKAIRNDLDEIYDEEKERLIARLEQQREATIAAAALKLSKFMRVESLGETIRIEILKADGIG